MQGQERIIPKELEQRILALDELEFELDEKLYSEALFVPSQQEAFERFWFDRRHFGFIGSRRLGKTHFALTCLILSMYYNSGLFTHYYPGGPEVGGLECENRDLIVRRISIMAGAPEYAFFLPGTDQSAGIVNQLLPGIIQRIYMFYPHLKKHPLQVTKKNAVLSHAGVDHTFIHGGLKRFAQEKLGFGFAMIILDEAAQHKEEDIDRILMPMFKNTGGSLLVTGTANSTAEFVKLRKSFTEGKHIKRHGMVVPLSDRIHKYKEKPEGIDLKYVWEDYDGDINNPIYRQEYECIEKLPIKDAVLEGWKPLFDRDDRVDIPPGPWYASCDIGFHYYPILYWALNHETGEIVLVDGKMFNKAHTPTILAEEKIRLAKRRAPLAPGGNQLHHAWLPHDKTKRSPTFDDTEELVWIRSRIADYVSPAPNTSIENSVLNTLRYLGKIKIAKGFPDEILEDLRKWKYDTDTKAGHDKPLKDNVHDHTGDAFRYGVTAIRDGKLFKPGVYVDENKSEMQKLIDDMIDDDSEEYGDFEDITDEKFW